MYLAGKLVIGNTADGTGDPATTTVQKRWFKTTERSVDDLHGAEFEPSEASLSKGGRFCARHIDA